MKRRNPAVET
jgi:hypothetical protein